MDLARECSSWSGKLHFRLIILVQGKASFHLHLWLFILKKVMDVFNCHQQHQISLFECKPIQKLFACKEYGKVHLFESSYKNKLVSKFFKFCCLFLFFLFAGLFMVIINSCWPLSGYTNAPAARNKGFRYPISKCLIQLLSVHLPSTHLQPVWRISFSTIFTMKIGKNWGMTCNVRRTTCLIHSYL